MKTSLTILLAFASLALLPQRPRAVITDAIRGRLGSEYVPISRKEGICLYRLHKQWNKGQRELMLRESSQSHREQLFAESRNDMWNTCTLRLRGGFERKTVFEGNLRKLQATSSSPSWSKLRVVLSDNALMCYRTPEGGGKGREEPDSDLGFIPLEEAEFLPVDSVIQPLPAKTSDSDNDLSMIEIRLLSPSANSYFLGCNSVEERNKWLLVLYQNRGILLRKRGWRAPVTWGADINRGLAGQLTWLWNTSNVIPRFNIWDCFGGGGIPQLEGRQMSKEPENITSPFDAMTEELAGNTSTLLDLQNVSEIAKEVANELQKTGQESLEPLPPSNLTKMVQEEAETRGRGNESVLEHAVKDEKLGSVYGEMSVVEASENQTATVIWLHSIGDSGGYFEDLPESLGVPWCRFVFPTAPTQAVTLHNGISQPSWFDISRIDDKGVVQDEQGLRESTTYILGLAQIDQEIARGVKSDRICVAGFGQGGVIAFNAALRCQHRLAGVAALSSWYRPKEKIQIMPHVVGLPALVCHGNADVFISPKLGRQVKDYLSALGLQTVFKAYPMMGHAFCPKELEDVHKWLLQVVPRNDSMRQLPTWIEAVVKHTTKGLTGSAKSNTRSLVLTEGFLQLYTLGQGTLLSTYDLMEYFAFAVQGAEGEPRLALRSHMLLDVTSDIDTNTSHDQAVNESFVFGSERERDEWLLAIARWQQTLMLRQNCSRALSVRNHPLAIFQPRAPPLAWSSLSWKSITNGIKQLFGAAANNIGRRHFENNNGRKGPVWENLVFSGGGIKSVVHPAALGVVADCYGEEGRDLHWVKRVAGVSAGSFVAVLVACGCTVEQIQEAASNFNVMKMTEGVSTIQGVRSMLQSYGVYDGTMLAEVVDNLIHKHTGIRFATFDQLYRHSGILLKIFATSVRSGALQEFSVERTPHDQVAMACRCSMAVPFLFQAVPTTEGDLLVDGGVLDNCPLDTFNEIQGVRNPKTLGFWITMVDDGQPAFPANLKSFALRMVELILYVEQHRAIEREKNNEVVWIPAPDIPLNTFSLNDETNRLLYECGSTAAARFLQPFQAWERKMGSWPSAMALFKELESPSSSLARDGYSKQVASYSVMRRYDKVRSFVRSWITQRRRLSRLTRDVLGPTEATR